MTVKRRDFLVTGAGALGAPLAACAPAVHRGGAAPDVAVIGAGAFGGWTAYHLRRAGARVLLVDMLGPGNSRSTSGDETRGVRSSYAERNSWIAWANDAMIRWRAWDEEHAGRHGRLFFPTGDLILRPTVDGPLQQTLTNWDSQGVPYERLTPEDVGRRWPQISTWRLPVAVFERNAGVVRSRRACEAVAAEFTRLGGELRLARVEPGRRDGSRLLDVRSTNGDAIGAGTFVFACGPWLPKVLPDVMRNRMLTPLGHVFYYGVPAGDRRFEYPNCPSFNVPGVTGWPGLPIDNRGFRVRVGGRPPIDPDLSDRWIDIEYHDRPRNVLCDRFPALLDAPLLETRACHYESSVDRNFIVDRCPGLTNAWIAGGGSAEGFKFGPVIGEYIARRVLGRPTDPARDEEFRLKEETFEDPAAPRSDDE